METSDSMRPVALADGVLYRSIISGIILLCSHKSMGNTCTGFPLESAPWKILI